MFKNKMQYSIDVDSKIIYQRFSGEVTLASIVKINDQTVNDPKFDWKYNWIIDVRNSKQLFAPNKIESFFQFYSKNANLFTNTKMAIIISSPKQYMTVDALITLFEINNIKITVKKVMDKGLAYSWISE